MIDRHWDGIVAYCQPENQVALGFVEGLNNKIRVIQRRAYGLRDEQYLRLKVLTCMLPEILADQGYPGRRRYFIALARKRSVPAGREESCPGVPAPRRPGRRTTYVLSSDAGLRCATGIQLKTQPTLRFEILRAGSCPPPQSATHHNHIHPCVMTKNMLFHPLVGPKNQYLWIHPVKVDPQVRDHKSKTNYATYKGAAMMASISAMRMS